MENPTFSGEAKSTQNLSQGLARSTTAVCHPAAQMAPLDKLATKQLGQTPISSCSLLS